MGTPKVSIVQFLIEAAALTTIAALIALIISAVLIRLVGSLWTAIDPPERNDPSQQNETIEGDVIRVHKNLVVVPISVMDRQGRYIPNMRRSFQATADPQKSVRK